MPRTCIHMIKPMRTFHDAVVVRFAASRDRIEINIESVSVYDGDESYQETGKLIVEGVSSFTENHEPVAAPTFKFDDGQILELEMHDRCLKLFVEWENYSSSATEVAEYEIHGDSVRWVPEAS
jgi:hypothetical protein